MCSLTGGVTVNPWGSNMLLCEPELMMDYLQFYKYDTVITHIRATTANAVCQKRFR
jgi:hypothetical protein